MTEDSEVKARWDSYFERLTRLIHQLSSLMSGAVLALLLTLQ